MKHCISSSISACACALLTTAFVSGAFAADLRAPASADVRNWTGCFAGVHVGGALSDDKIRSSGDFSSTGFIAGGQVGCDYQFASAWVVGVGARAAWSSLSSNTPGRGMDAAGAIFPTQFTVANDFLASTTARLGHNFAPGWLAYAAGGVAWTREKDNIVFTPPALGFAINPSGTTTRTGWTAGAGVEWAFAPHWSTNLEYDYYDFGSNDFLLTDTVNGATFRGNLRDTIHTLTAGLNYRF